MTHKRIAIMAAVSIFLLVSLPAKAKSILGKTADTAWPMYQHDPQHTGRSPLVGPTHQPELLWTALFPHCSGENGGITITQDGSLLLPVGGCLHSFDPITREEIEAKD